MTFTHLKKLSTLAFMYERNVHDIGDKGKFGSLK